MPSAAVRRRRAAANAPSKPASTRAAAKGLRLDDTFTKTGGGGNTAVGGSTIILTQNTYRFLPSGRFVQGSFVGFSSEGAAGTSVPADQAGTYEINGYQLTLRYDSGTSVVKSFVAGKPAGDILWIGGATFLAESTR